MNLSRHSEWGLSLGLARFQAFDMASEQEKRTALYSKLSRMGAVYDDEDTEQEMVLVPVNVLLDAVEIVYLELDVPGW